MVDPEPAAARPNVIKPLAIFLSIVLTIFGLWTSLQYTLASWGTDADVANTVMLWSGVHQHGIGFLKTWYYTQDNWLLSLVPLAFAQFALLGVKPFFVVISGWVIFTGCVGVAMLLAQRVAGAVVCLGLAPFLLLCNVHVLGWPDFFGYPATHNISLLWGLVALWLAGRWIGSGGGLSLFAALFALVVNGISDPWAMPAFVLPIALGACISFVVIAESTIQLRAVALLGTAMLAALLCFTKLVGILSFLPSEQFQLAGWPQMNANVSALPQMIATMFLPFPGLQGSWPISDTATCISLALLTAIAAVSLIRRYRDLAPAALFLIAATSLSIAGVTAAFILSIPPDLSVMGRYFLNVYVLLPVLVCAGLLRAERATGWWLGAACFGLLITLSGVTSQPSAWARTRVHVNDFGTVALARFLESNGLHRGYGDYWGTQSSAVSWVSGGKVLVRAVTFDPISGRISPRTGQTSPFWYGPGEASAFPTTFVIVGPSSMVCGQVQRCVDGLSQQFGPPARVLPYQDLEILVWDRSLALNGG